MFISSHANALPCLLSPVALSPSHSVPRCLSKRDSKERRRKRRRETREGKLSRDKHVRSTVHPQRRRQQQHQQSRRLERAARERKRHERSKEAGGEREWEDMERSKAETGRGSRNSESHRNEAGKRGRKKGSQLTPEREKDAARLQSCFHSRHRHKGFRESFE